MNSKYKENLNSGEERLPISPVVDTAIKSSFPLLQRYSGRRGDPTQTIFDWFQVKRRDDNVGTLWRVHDKLYDLEDFIKKHPGGPDWIRATKGIDITESFEASHVVNVKSVENILQKYYVTDAKIPRNSPYTFNENGFYKTLKRKIEPILKKVGTDSTPEMLLMQDALGLVYFLIATIAVSNDLLLLKIFAGVVLSLCITGAHNFFHKKDNWRRFYFDLSPLSSYEWRLSHAITHHSYPNTVLDTEISFSEPFAQFLPLTPRNAFLSYLSMFYAHLMYPFFMLVELFKRPITIFRGQQKLRPENVIIYIELALFLMIAPTYLVAVKSWLIIFMSTSYVFVFVSKHASHHHFTNFHDGDEARKDPDFGLCQLDATSSKSDWYHQSLFAILTTFGEHSMHHLFPTVCHSKLKYIKPIVLETLKEFYEVFPEVPQWDLFVSTHLQMTRTKPNPLSVRSEFYNLKLN